MTHYRLAASHKECRDLADLGLVSVLADWLPEVEPPTIAEGEHRGTKAAAWFGSGLVSLDHYPWFGLIGGTATVVGAYLLQRDVAMAVGSVTLVTSLVTLWTSRRGMKS